MTRSGTRRPRRHPPPFRRIAPAPLRPARGRAPGRDRQRPRRRDRSAREDGIPPARGSAARKSRRARARSTSTTRAFPRAARSTTAIRWRRERSIAGPGDHRGERLDRSAASRRRGDDLPDRRDSHRHRRQVTWPPIRSRSKSCAARCRPSPTRCRTCCKRTSYNMMIYEVGDYCCAILDAGGQSLGAERRRRHPLRRRSGRRHPRRRRAHQGFRAGRRDPDEPPGGVRPAPQQYVRLHAVLLAGRAVRLHHHPRALDRCRRLQHRVRRGHVGGRSLARRTAIQPAQDLRGRQAQQDRPRR